MLEFLFHDYLTVRNYMLWLVKNLLIPLLLFKKIYVRLCLSCGKKSDAVSVHVLNILLSWYKKIKRLQDVHFGCL